MSAERKPLGQQELFPRGLSGAGRKWYKRYLDQGMAPEQAKARAFERKTTGPSVANGANAAVPAQKRAPQQTTATANTGVSQAKKPKNNDPQLKKTCSQTNAAVSHTKGQVISQLKQTKEALDVTIAKAPKVAILASDYPRRLLKKDELVMIKSALVTEMRKGWSSSLNFSGMEFRIGLMLVSCLDEETKAWLDTAVSKITAIQDVTLRTFQWDEIPNIRLLSLKLPRAVGEDKKTVMSLLEKQNQNLQPENWLFLKCNININGIFMVLGIEAKTLEAVKARGMCLSYLFNQIPCILLPQALLDLPHSINMSTIVPPETSPSGNLSSVEDIFTEALNIKTEDNNTESVDFLLELDQAVFQVMSESSACKCNCEIIVIDDD